MKTCGDCIYADSCERNPALELFSRTNPAFCKGFTSPRDLWNADNKQAAEIDFDYEAED